MAAPIKPRAKFPIKRQSLPDILAEALRERILSGEFRDGDSLVQENIAEEYEVSRMPVREALRQLEVQGLVALRTHRGAIVISLSREKLIELLNLRILLECDILSEALKNFRETDLSTAEEILNDFEKAYRNFEISNQRKLNWEFHKCLYLAANRPETLSIIEGINLRTDRFIREPLGITGGIHSAEKENRELLRLCAARDPAAIDYLERHICAVIKSLPLQRQDGIRDGVGEHGQYGAGCAQINR
ncbi:GntR family transcriptional regulator [Mesorhizobium opportunistum]|uniref:GntR family transcriptional regulator n=1 Tax=Mesorhizobium opportunistum TaxID=593909 RepID=UPI003338700F